MKRYRIHVAKYFLCLAILSLVAVLFATQGLCAEISYLAITDDATSEITNTTVYTHAVDFGSDATRALINGVQFQAGGTTFGTIVGTSATVGTGTTTIPSNHGGSGDADPYLNGGAFCNMEDLVEDMIYNDGTALITLSGLTPGQTYRFRLYNRVWGGSAGTRTQDIGFDTDGVGTTIADAEDTGAFSQDDATDPDPGFSDWWQVYAYTYDYSLAPGVTELKIYINEVSGGTYHLYGLTNEEFDDTNAPIVSVLSPADDLTGAYPGADLVLSFNEQIALTNSGTITITNITLSSSQIIPIPDGQLSVSDNVLTINPSANLAFNTSYAVMISSNAVIDLATNFFAGITNSTAWNFDTAAQDLSAPTITATTPTDDATGVVPSANLIAVFDQNVVAGSGNITVTNVTDSTHVTNVAISDITQVSISTNVLTIDLSGYLDPAVELAVRMDAGVVKNYSDVDFAGISDSTTWSFTTVSDTTYDGSDSTWNNDDWNNAANWDHGVPSGSLDALIGASETASVDGDIAPAYSGTLTLGSSASLHINNVGDINALGTSVLMSAGSRLILVGDSYTVPVPITLLADAEMKLSESSGGHHTTKTFTKPISGAYGLSLFTGNNNTYKFQTSNSFAGLTLNAGNSRVDAEAAGSLGVGDVRMNNAATLRIYASGSMADTGTLYLVGSGDAKLPSPYYKLYMNADETIGGLDLDGYAYPTGTYGRVGLGGVDYEYSWISGNATLTVTNAPADTTPPTVVFSGVGLGGSSNELYATESATYTITFDEPHTPALTASDLDNASGGGITIDSFVVVSGDYHNLEYQVVVTPSVAGTLQLRIKSGVAIEDLFGNALVTPATDSNVFTVDELPGYEGELGVWQPWANGRTNPVTGVEWAIGDQYRLAFVSSGTRDATSPDIADYDAFLQAAADAVGWGAATWRCVGRSYNEPNAASNTLTSGGGGLGIFLVDGSTKIADDYTDLWNNSIDNYWKETETGSTYSGDVATGAGARKFGDPAQSNIDNGTSGKTDGGWWNNYNRAKTNPWHFYAISDPLTVVSTGAGSVFMFR